MKVKNKGFTLLEVILTVMIMTLVYLVVSNVFTLTIRANRIANTEFNMQANMRNVSETLNQNIKLASSVFTLKKETFEKEKKPGWKYFGIEEVKDANGIKTGKKQIVEYSPIIEKTEVINGETVITFKTEAPTHAKRILLDEPEDMNFNLYFSKDTTNSEGKLLEFVIEAVQNNSIQRKMTVKTQLQALNSMVVEHEGSPAVAIAYKEDMPGKRIKGTQEAYAIITLVLDRSGSMDARDINDNGVMKKRIDVLNEKTNKLINDLKDAGDKIYLRVIPYNSRVTGHNSSLPNFQHIQSASSVNLTASGGTNTGEALLMSYQMLQNKPGVTIPTGAKVNYYNILLTDGEPLNITRYILRGDRNAPYSSYPTQDMDNRYRTRDVYSWFGLVYDYTEHYFFRDKWTSSLYVSGNSYASEAAGLTQSMQYVKRIAKDYISVSPLNIKSYIIGFGPGMDANSKEIASYCVGLNSMINDPRNKPNEKGEQTKAYYSATSAEELDIIYSELTEMIKGDMWHVMGPY